MKCLGMDLGTTNTVAAVDGRIVPVGRGDGERVLPSVVAYLPSGRKVGAAARRRRVIDPRNTIFSAKRVIGRGWHSYETATFRDTYPFDLVPTEDGGVGFSTRAGVVTPKDVAAAIVATLLERSGVRPAECRACVTVPTRFEETQREATRSAAADAGLADITIVDEPVATAMAYESLLDPAVKSAVVYDLGGGTFDVSVLDCSQRPFRVLAHGGDGYLGGDDIDRVLARSVAQRVLEMYRWDLAEDPQVFDRLVLEVERAKIRLSYASEAVVELGQVDPASPVALQPVTLERSTLEASCRELMQRTFAACDRVASEAGVRPQDVDTVLLSGGSTHLPMLRKDVARYFGCTPRVDRDPMEVVAIGASVARG